MPINGRHVLQNKIWGITPLLFTCLSKKYEGYRMESIIFISQPMIIWRNRKLLLRLGNNRLIYYFINIRF